MEGVGDATKVAKILQTECNVSELAVELNVVAVQFLKEAENARDLQQLGPSHLHRSIDAMNFHIVISIETQEFFAAGAQRESINNYNGEI